jgi:CBS domain containing-hemolysin-like protein
MLNHLAMSAPRARTNLTNLLILRALLLGAILLVAILIALVEFQPLRIVQTTGGGATWTTFRAIQQQEALTRLTISGNRLYALAGNRVVMYALD